MFFYTHVLESIVLGEESSASETQPGINASSSYQAFTGSTLSFTRTDRDAAQDFSSSASGITSYSSGTYPRSMTAFTASSTSQEGTTSGTGTDEVLSSLSVSGTFTVLPLGSSTGLDTFSWTHPATTTTQFSTAWTGSLGSVNTTLTATATATATHSSATVSASASGVTLVPIFAVSRATAQRWYVARRHPPPLRRAAVAFALSGIGSSSGPVGPLPSGSVPYGSDFVLGTSLSTSVFETSSTDNSFRQAFSSTILTGKSISASSSAVAQLSAARRSLSGSNMVWDGSWGSGLSASPDVSGLALSADVAQGLSSVSVWTTTKTHLQTSFCWSYLSSSWILHASSSAGTSLSTYTVQVAVVGSLQTTTAAATLGLGISTALLGPLIPASTEQLNEVSVSSLTSIAGGHVLFTGRLSASASSSSKTFPSSSSEQFSLGSGSAFPLTYAASLLSMAARLPAITAQTQTFSSLSPALLSAPSLFSADKWNEAGRNDPVAVDQ